MARTTKACGSMVTCTARGDFCQRPANFGRASFTGIASISTTARGSTSALGTRRLRWPLWPKVMPPTCPSCASPTLCSSMRSSPGSPGMTTWSLLWSRIPAASLRTRQSWTGLRAPTRTPPSSSSSWRFRSSGTTTIGPGSTTASRRHWWRGSVSRLCLSPTKRILKQGSPSPRHCKSFLIGLLFHWKHLTPACFMGASTRCPFCPRTAGRSISWWLRRPRRRRWPRRPSPRPRGRRRRRPPRPQPHESRQCCTASILW
mmetsp:Transcript_19744/g.50068  ORF Transcript_19744/g.50068 Transcript_19744/m.50068 type:complete len:259 (-) Transcript_19744:207-983(-)